MEIAGAGGDTLQQLRQIFQPVDQQVDDGILPLQPAVCYRRDIDFLMTRVCNHDYEGAKQNLEDSLKWLQTDHLDLWKFHEMMCDNDPGWVFERGGIKAALEVGRDFKPLRHEQLAEILEKVRNAAAAGRHELFRTSKEFDGPYHRKQHGFAVE